MKINHLLRVIVLLGLLVSLIPAGVADASSLNAAPPPTDFFQLPWDQGLAWYAIDGIDNGYKRPLSSSHNYTVGGAIDFAPRVDMIKGENTSNFWVSSAAAGTVVGVSSCHVILDHGNGWVTQYQFLGNIQVKLGDVVSRNQHLGIIADGVRYPFCLGSIDPDIPHLHFMLRPTLIGATFAGWEVRFNSLFDYTSFRKNGATVGLYRPLMNMFDSVTTPSPIPSPTSTLPIPTSITSLPTDTTPLPPTSTTPLPTNTTPLPPASTTPTPADPYVSTNTDRPGINIGETALITVSLNNLPLEGYTSAEFTCAYDPAMLEVSNITVTNLFGVDPVMAINGPQNGSFIFAIAGSRGNKAVTSDPVFTFNGKGLQAGEIVLDCKARVNAGNNVLTDLPSIGTILTIMRIEPTPTFTSMPPVEPSFTPTPMVPVDTWLTFSDNKYSFLFRYPPGGQVFVDLTDSYARIDLPFVQGTNLSEKYLEVFVAENADPCQSPLATQSMLATSEVVVINGISFLKQTGGDAGAGNIYQWVAYSTSRENICVSLDFILHSHNPGNYPTPPPVFDYAAETAVFEQMVATYQWSALPTATPTSLLNGLLSGQVFASKPVTVKLIRSDGSIISAVSPNPDGTFTLTAPTGTYSIVTSSSGFLTAQASVTFMDGSVATLPPMNLPAGDIDSNNIIDQFDALTIGMNYNAVQPSIADLNNDGVINVLDLEMLAGNYRKTGPVVWQVQQ